MGNEIGLFFFRKFSAYSAYKRPAAMNKLKGQSLPSIEHYSLLEDTAQQNTETAV